ncbi:MAG: SGNH/GDSL hydrolase family protein [Gemmatimonadaceae bacterium]
MPYNENDIKMPSTTSSKDSARAVRAVWAVAAFALMVGAALPSGGQTPISSNNWIGTWTASPQPKWDGDFPLPALVPFNLWNQTVRQIVGVSLGGTHIRVVLSNAYGSEPLVIGAAHVALAASGTISGGSIAPASDRVITFGGKTTVTIPPGAPVVSDPVDLTVPALGRLAVSLFLPEPSPTSTFHWDGEQTGYIVAGNQVTAAGMEGATKITSRVYLSEILVDAPAGARSVVGFGDSITDGAGSTLDTDHRWTDFLAQRLATDNVSVLNAGISGARMLKDRMGTNALARFDRDVLSQPHVKTVIVLMGINDISWPGHIYAPRDPALTPDELITGYRQLIARARSNRVRIVGATLTPFEGALENTPLKGYYSTAKDQVRQAVNTWIRTSGEFDAVIDLDALMRDPQHPTRLRPAFDSGDHLHPGDAGYKIMADALESKLLFGGR